MVRDVRALERAFRDDPVHAADRLAQAQQRVLNRRASVPPVTFPEELPITQHIDELRRLLERHRVLIVAGETGSGKTTQLPKLCLAAGYGVRGSDRSHAAADVSPRARCRGGLPKNSACRSAHKSGMRCASAIRRRTTR